MPTLVEVGDQIDDTVADVDEGFIDDLAALEDLDQPGLLEDEDALIAGRLRDTEWRCQTRSDFFENDIDLSAGRSCQHGTAHQHSGSSCKCELTFHVIPPVVMDLAHSWFLRCKIRFGPPTRRPEFFFRV